MFERILSTPIHTLYYVIYAATIMICITAAALLFFTQNPPFSSARCYIKAKQYIIIAALLTALQLTFSTLNNEVTFLRVELFNFFLEAVFFAVIIFISSALLSLLRYDLLSRRNIRNFIIIGGCFIVLYGVLASIWGDIRVYTIHDLLVNIRRYPALILRVIFAFQNLLMLIMLLPIWSKSYKKYQETIDDYYSENEIVRMRWINRLYFYSGLVAVLTNINFFIPNWHIDAVATIFAAALFISYTIRFINYQYHFYALLKAFEHTDESHEADEHETQTVIDMKTKRQMIRVRKWIQSEEKPFLKENINIDDVAGEMGISRRNLSRIINTQFNLNFNAWINDLRIEEVIRLMRTGNYSLSEIAFKTGFSDLSTMSRVFKKSKGVTPSAYHPSEAVE